MSGPSTLRARRRLVLLVLTALLLRALIPTGFMPFAGPGGPHLGFCPAAGALPPDAHAHYGGRGAPPAPHHPTCLFSAGAATVFGAVPAPAPAAPTELTPGEHRASHVVLPTILRAQSS